MKGRDWGLIIGGIAVSLGAAFWANASGLAAGDITGTQWIPRLAVVAVLVGALFAYLARDFYGGTVARGLHIIGIGFLIYGIIWWPHKIGWHGGGEAAWLGIIEPAWQTFFHLLTVITLGIVAYGFYWIWRGGQ
jgi:hypothetical protein